ncbi:hypothetical protein C2S51_023759 [Perilla frutescens var. frutescens]|nr:hypothetical protein C2S51_023759 [Perilla frutescens var. frutescens]
MALMKNVKGRVKGYSEMVMNMVIGAVDETKKVGGEDRRRMLHSIKVGIAMAAVSLMYYFDIFQEGYSSGSGLDAMWAVITVAAVFEFSIGATIGKGVNRTLATIIGGALIRRRSARRDGVRREDGGVHHACAVRAFSLYVDPAAATFGRFFPKLKARNDYCFLIIIVTYGLTAVSTYRGEKLTQFAEKRLSTALIGFATVLICCCICPCWAGQDLHNLIATNIEKLGIFMEGFAREYFETMNEKSQEARASMLGYKVILNSKATEESLVNFAKWEPRHGKFRYWHPWDQYLKVGSLTRECACRIDALNTCLNSEMHAPLEIRRKMKEACTEMSWECSNALRELAVGIRAMTQSSPADPHMRKAESVANNLKSLLQTPMWPDSHLLDTCPATTVALVLIETVSCTSKVADSVHQFASLSKFKNPSAITPDQRGQENVTVIPVDTVNEGNVMIVVPLDDVESIDRSHQSSNE